MHYPLFGSWISRPILGSLVRAELGKKGDYILQWNERKSDQRYPKIKKILEPQDWSIINEVLAGAVQWRCRVGGAELEASWKQNARVAADFSIPKALAPVCKFCVMVCRIYIAGNVSIPGVPENVWHVVSRFDHPGFVSFFEIVIRALGPTSPAEHFSQLCSSS